MKWVEDNEQMLISYTLRSSSALTSSLTLAPIEDEVQTFLVEGKISLSDHTQFFYFLAFSYCNHFVLIKTKKMVQCFNYKLEQMLVPSECRVPTCTGEVILDTNLLLLLNSG